MTLRNTLVAQIYNAIEQSAFTIADFAVTFGDGDSEPLVGIVFLHQEEFSLTVYEDHNGASSTESPGEHKKTETVRLSSMLRIPDRVEVWIRNVRDELRTTVPVYAELDDLKAKLEKHINEHVSNPDVPFSAAEADEMREKLNDLLSRLEEMEKKSEITEQELNRLKKELTSIKANVTTFPKGVWYKTAANKLWAVTSKIATSQESRQVLAKAAQKMLGLDP